MGLLYSLVLCFASLCFFRFSLSMSAHVIGLSSSHELAAPPSHPQLLLSDKYMYVSTTRACPVMNTSRTDRCSVLLLVFVLPFSVFDAQCWKLSLLQLVRAASLLG